MKQPDHSSPLEGERALPLQSRGGYRRSNTHHAKKMRRDLTPWEFKLWIQLKQKQQGHKFRRQQPVGTYIVDFLNTETKLVVELDGSQHLTEAARDAERDAFLKQRGYTVLRFWNNQVDENLQEVLEQIRCTLQRLSPHDSAKAESAPPQGGSYGASL